MPPVLCTADMRLVRVTHTKSNVLSAAAAAAVAVLSPSTADDRMQASVEIPGSTTPAIMLA